MNTVLITLLILVERSIMGMIFFTLGNNTIEILSADLYERTKSQYRSVLLLLKG